MRWAQRRDDNEHTLVSIAKQFGAVWKPTGPLDGWLGHRGLWTPVEIKHGSNPYTPIQRDFLAMCRQRKLPVFTWRTDRDVFESLGARQTA